MNRDGGESKKVVIIVINFEKRKVMEADEHIIMEEWEKI